MTLVRYMVHHLYTHTVQGRNSLQYNYRMHNIVLSPDNFHPDNMSNDQRNLFHNIRKQRSIYNNCSF